MYTVRKVETEQDYQAALAVRRSVFIEEQGVPAAAEVDEHEAQAHHFVAFNPSGIACGAARWRQTANGAKLERFAVLQQERRRSVGRRLLIAVMEDVERVAPDQISYLHAQIDVVNFYVKHGFEPYGETFVECDIIHQAMRRRPESRR